MRADIFPHSPVLPGEIDTLLVKRTPTFDVNKHMIDKIAAETERWVRKAIEKGAGWNVWRSNPRTKDGDVFIIVHDFALVPPGAAAPGAGWLFTQPDFTDGERVRLLAGRHDWREDAWEDECGVLGCGHPCCERARA